MLFATCFRVFVRLAICILQLKPVMNIYAQCGSSITSYQRIRLEEVRDKSLIKVTFKSHFLIVIVACFAYILISYYCLTCKVLFAGVDNQIHSEAM